MLGIFYQSELCLFTAEKGHYKLYQGTSVSEQDESNPALSLATWAGNDRWSRSPGWSYLAHSGLSIVSRKKNFPESHINTKSFIDQAFSVKDDWILALLFFCEFMDLDSVLVHKHTKKELGQYPATLTSHLVNNNMYRYA